MWKAGGPQWSPPLIPKKTTFEKKKMEKINEKSKDMGVKMSKGDPRPCLRRERRPVALHPCSGVLLEGGALTSGMCVGDGGEVAPSGFMCALGAGRDKGGPKEQGPGTRSLAPPRPQVPGVQEPSSGVQGYMQRSVPPPMGWIQLERK